MPVTDPHSLVRDMVDRARAGEVRAVARLISMIEDSVPNARVIDMAVSPLAGAARVVGLTGAPGVGKSTFTAALITALRTRGDRVGVLAVDPTSPFSGGALLGDRIRMQDHAKDKGVYIRSLATRGQLGGLSAATPLATRVLDAAGCRSVLIETVGVGQSEVDISVLADTTVVILAPGMGDSIQASKAGLMETGDIFVVNKADREGAATTRRELRAALARSARPQGSWQKPIVMTTATTGEGLSEVLGHLEAHAVNLEESGELELRRRNRMMREIEALAVAELHDRIFDPIDRKLERAVDRVMRGHADPHGAATALIEGL
jgi:LAO/AO transport system kinase